jgi:hypothetical protein
MEVHGTIVLDDDKRLRGVLGPRLQGVMESGKVQASGFLGGKRGAFLHTPGERWTTPPAVGGRRQVAAVRD